MAGKTSADENLMQEKLNKNTIIMLVLSLCFIAAATFVYLQLTSDDHLPIKQISISGAFENVKPQELQKIINQDVKGNFFTLDVERLYESLMSLEWIQTVLIHRVWPDRLNIEMREQVPVAVVVKKGLLNANGDVFTNDVSGYADNLPKFSVTDRYYSQAITAYQQLTGILQNHNMSINEFVFDERKSQLLVLNNGIEIVLGRHEAEQRFSRFMKAFGIELAARKEKIKRVDLRFTNGFAVSGTELTNSYGIKEVYWS